MLKKGDGVNDWGVMGIELIGTFMLTTTIQYAKYSPDRQAKTVHLAGLFIGSTLAIAAKMGGAKSGGAYNPAVTLSMVLLAHKDTKYENKATFIIEEVALQLVAGTLAGLWTSLVHIKTLKNMEHSSVGKQTDKVTPLHLEEEGPSARELQENPESIEKSRKETEEAKDNLQSKDILGNVLQNDQSYSNAQLMDETKLQK